MYKTYDLDDFVEDGNDAKVKVMETTVINVNTLGNIELSGELTGGMVAINTNNLDGDLKVQLNNVKIDTDSKKIPAIYVYNKDITYSKCKVTIETKEGTSNYIEGGKFKKVSLIPIEELSNYSSKYSSTAATWYSDYTKYYGVYTKDQIANVLFATVTADREDLEDGDPYYYYKGSGAISSDIDLNFEGKGYLEVISKNKEGIETKGSLSLVGGTGDYVVKSQDDCLNTTTDFSENSNAHNDLTIDVNSLVAIVDLDADEGDAIDSNGILTINGGTIMAFAKPGQDAGIDSEKGTYINGGTVIATGDMYDEVKEDSKQKFVVLSFGSSVSEDTLITLLNSEGSMIFGYKTDRTYTNLIYSSSSLTDGTYSLYQDGSIEGIVKNGVYLTGTYTKGIQLGYTSNMVSQMGGGGQMGQPMDGNKPSGNNMPMNQSDDRPEPPVGGDNPGGNMGGNPGEGPQQWNGSVNATNKDFVISGIANMFSGIGVLKSE